MAIAREAIYKAMYQRLQEKLPEVKFWTRRDTDFDQLGASAIPAAVFMITDQSADDADGRTPAKWRLGAQLVLYSRTDGHITPDEVLNDLLDKVEEALELQPGEMNARDFQTTLGGLVYRAGISGTVSFIEGDSSQGGLDAVAIIPVEMFATA